MIWLASFPRSGNTFFRNILKDVYGISSSEFHLQAEYGVEEGYENFPVVKTHLLPGLVEPSDPDIPVVYLMRDGRDSVVSQAHHTQDIVLPGTDFLQNMTEGIIAAEGSYFGGWSNNALQWIRRAAVVIRYEDLIKDPIAQVEKLRAIIEMPEPKRENLPTFAKLKASKDPYGVRTKAKEDISKVANKFFRKGKAGSWKEEMPQEMLALFYSCHGEMMDLLGYNRDGTWVEEDEFQKRIETIKTLHSEPKRPLKILMEANKLADPQRDGINRYVYSLCEAMDRLQKNKGEFGHIDVDLLVQGEIQPLHQDLKITSKELEEQAPPPWVVNTKNTLRKWLPGIVYKPFRKLYLLSPARLFLKKKAILMKLMEERKNLKESSKLFEKYDLIHITLPQHYANFRLMKHNFLATVHDMTHKLFPKFHLRGNINNAKKGLKFLKKNNAHILAVSEATKADLCKLEGFTEQNVSVVLEAADRERFNKIYDQKKLDQVLEKYALKGVSYFFSLATLEPRKNMERTLEAFLALKEKYPESKVKFVLAGKSGWKQKTVSEHPDILPIGYVVDEDLSTLFTACLGFCYISHYEGFGLPLIEAMRCGAPVIYGQNSSMIEIVEGAGLAADSENQTSITTQMEKFLLDKNIRAEYSRKSFFQSLNFSWERAARETFELYESLSPAQTGQAGGGIRTDGGGKKTNANKTLLPT